MGLRSWYLIALLFFLPLGAKAEFGFHAGTHFGLGKMGSETGISPNADRSMGTFDLQAMPGFRFAGIMGGLMLDYRLMSQLTDETEVRSDYGGRGFNVGLGLMFEPAMLKVLLGWDFRARHWYSGPDTTYKGSGWRFLIGYKFLPGFSFDLQYMKSSYNTAEVNGIENGLDPDSLRHWDLGIGVSYSF